MQRWEYKIVYFTEEEARLNALGNDGWELVSVYKGAMYLKRPKA
jgi:hypothetical protein